MLKHEFDEIASGMICDTYQKRYSNVIFLSDGIRAIAKLCSELTQQGARKSDPEGLPPMEDFLSVFVRWRQEDKDMDYFLTNFIDIPPYVFCETFAFAEGVYYVMINGVALHIGHNFFLVLDVALKSYKVFNYQIPSKAKKVISFFDILIYETCKFSRTAAVNNLCDKFRKALRNPTSS